MSRITGNDAYGLMEAYSAVYQPRLELTEEQIWEEVEYWVNELIEEGYDLSDYTWEEMYEAYIEEARAEGVKPYKAGPTQADVRADAAAARQKHVSGAAKQSGYGPEDKFKSDWKLRATPSSTTKRRDGSVETVSQRMDREQPYKKRMTGELARKQGSRIASAVTRTIEGPGEPQAVTMPRMKAKVSKEIIRKEEVDVYDIILSHLLDEGYANSVDAAEAIMVNMSEDWRDIIIEEILDEAEGSYGQTPKARTAMGKLLMARSGKPASEYGKRGEKTKKVKAAEKHTRRMDNGPDVGNRGKRSTSPRWSGYLGATGRGRMDQDSRDWSRERDVEYSAGENKPGSGTVTRNPKKLRKQRAMGEID